jgi:small subunit ribosomal protein S5
MNPRGRDRSRSRSREREEPSEFIDKLVHINRVARCEGRPAFRLRGARRGRRPEGPRRPRHGKAREVPEAIRKATDAAKRNLIRVPLREGRTLHH